MFHIERISLNLSYNSAFFIVGFILIAAYVIYIYRYTIPMVDKKFKIFLITIRTLALILILFAVFEPILVLTKRNSIEPVNLIFIDNSKSINTKDNSDKSGTIRNFLVDAENYGTFKYSRIYSFGSKVTEVNRDSTKKINFSESVTDFSKIFDFKNEEQNISAVVVVSDGVITDGPNPVFKAEKAGIPVYTIGVGDTVSKNNIEVRRVLHNELIYAQTPTIINTSIYNSGFTGKVAEVSLYEENNLLEQQNISLQDGLNNISFNYTPKSAGEKKLNISVSRQSGEMTYADNNKVFYINVLDNKINVLVLAGSPSADLSFIKNTLAADENLKIRSIIEIGNNKFLESKSAGKAEVTLQQSAPGRNAAVDSADILFLIGFPSAQTPTDLFNRVTLAIKNSKPFFFQLSPGTDLNKLRTIQSDLPFTITNVRNGFTETQPDVSANESDNPLLQNSAENNIEAWNNLPPVFKSNSDFNAKPESNVLSRIKMRNTPINYPLIITRNLARQKSIAVLAKDIWKWKLQTADRQLDVYDSFILNSIKWLNSSENQKLVRIHPVKKVFSLGEPVEFTGQVYNTTSDPVEDAEINVNLTSGTDKYSISMESIGSGLYQGTLLTNKSGDYSYSGTAKLNNNVLGSDNGKFSIGDVDIEMINTSLDKDMLNLLSAQTHGKFFYDNNYKQLFDILKRKVELKSDTRLTQSEFSLWSNEWLLLITIILFGIEWFFRKRAGML